MMTDARQVQILSAGLVLAAIAIIAVKLVAYDMPLTGGGEAVARPGPPAWLDPFRDRPAAELETFRIMLTIPVGIALLVILRQFVGLQTIGTFMPVLIGVSFHATGAVVGVALFTVIVAIGLVVRLYFERLRLLLVPRLASVVTLVVILMLALTLGFSSFGLDFGTSATVFPLVILAMTVERMAVAWEELDPSDALFKALGSLAVALMSYGLMSLDPLQDLMLRFPEILLILLAFTIFMGRYRGLRLSELVRFKDVSK